MKKELAYYDVYPKIVQTQKESTIRIEAVYWPWDESVDYSITIYPMDTRIELLESSNYEELNIKAKDKILEFTYAFKKEQEYVLQVKSSLSTIKEDLLFFSVYALDEDLFNRKAFKGDFHLHSFRSDGRENPAFVAASCRKIGLDFMALTDHRQYQPSIEAQEAFCDADIDLKIFPGEEIHPPGNDVHMINYGGKFSVNELFKEDSNWREEVKALENEVTDFPDGISLYEYCCCKWVFNKTREAGGLAIYCHPYWVCGKSYHVKPAFNDYMFEKQDFDAFEVLGGHTPESNMLQVSRYHEERAKGKKIPIVGASDAHGCERNVYFGWYYTIVFSEDLQLDNIINGVKDLYSVAVEHLPGEEIRIHGPYRLVKYALFLNREVFPKHDQLCHEEGTQMLNYLHNKDEANSVLKQLQGRTDELYKKYWND